MLNQYLLKSKHEEQMISRKLLDLLYSLGTVRPITEETNLFYQGKAAKEVYLIKSGLIRISMISSEGEEMILRICRENDLVGELTLYCDNPQYLLNAKVVESGEVIAVSIDTLHNELLDNTDLAIELMRWTSNHMRRYQMKMKDLLLNGKRGALYTTLIRLTNSYGIGTERGILIDIELTHSHLAKFCGASREYVNRILMELRRKEVLELEDNGKILIKDLQYLKDESNCENCPIEICNIN